MSQIPLLLQALNEPLCIDPRFGHMLVSVFARKLAGGHFSGADLHAELGVAMPSARPRTNADATIAVIPVYGVIAQHGQSMGTSCDQIDALLAQALGNKAVDGILFEFDSPGGTVAGVPELAAKIRAAGQAKPIAAMANGLAASAAYWLASQTDDVTVLGSGDGVGSIGVYTAHHDLSKALEQEGVSVTAISAGKYKTEGAPWAPLSDEARATLQSRVDEVYGQFVKDVAAGRGTTQTAVREGYGEGRVVSGAAAVKAGLADRVGTFEDAIARLSGKIAARRGGMSADSNRRKLALDLAAE